jgi:outer membrane protein TolC
MKNKTKFIFQLFAFILISSALAAQTPKSSFSLAEAQEYAMQNSYVLHNTRQDIAKSQKEVWKTITIGLPQVSGSMEYTKNILAAKSPFPVAIIPKDFWPALGIPEDTPPDGTYPISFMQKYNSNFGFTVSQKIFDGSYIVAVGSSQIYLNLAKQAHEKTEIDIRDAVAQAYYMVLIGIQNKSVMEENLVNVQKLYTETKAYYDNGFMEEQDVDQMKLLVKNAENEVLKAGREIKIATVVLKYAMGYDMEEEIELTNKIDDFLNPILGVNNQEQLNLSNHIDFKLAQTNFQVSEKLLKLEKATYLPSLSSFYSYSRTAYGNKANLFNSSVSWFPSSLIGFQLSVPIFNSGQKMFKVQQAKIDLDKAETQRKLTEVTLQKDYLTAKAELETALEKYENDKENIALAEKILDKSKIKFNNGITSSTELSQIETQYIQSHGAFTGSTLQLLQADLKLKKAIGKL